MENGNNDIKIYSAEDLARYWEGKMSAQEMHALEAAAMEDPFLADALEGYAAVKPATAAADIDELRERLLNRTQDEKIVPLIKKKNNWWRVAAILIFLGGASILTYLLMQQNASNQLATKEVAASEKKDSAPALPADTLTAQYKQPDTQKLAAKLKSNNSYHYSTEPSVNQQGNATATVTKSIDDVSVPDLSDYKPKDNPAANASADKIYSNDSLALAQNEAKRNQQYRAAADNNARDMANQRLSYNNFSGRVVDQRNNAIPYASVRMNNNQVTATNNDGYFQIKSPDSLIDVSVTSVGFEPRQLTLRGNEPLNVTLDEQDSKKMKEVVVTAGSSRKKSVSTRRDSKLSVYVMDAEPVPGWDEYNKYLTNNKRATTDTTSGEVVVSFWVNKKGQLSDFTIEQSISKTQDAEAMRLIKEGPAWKLMKGKKTRARVIVPF